MKHYGRNHVQEVVCSTMWQDEDRDAQQAIVIGNAIYLLLFFRKDPQGKMHPATETTSARPGFYYEINSAGKPDFCYAVNGSFAEGDPATVAPDEIVAAIERAPGEVLGGLDLDAASASAARGLQKKDAGLWWALLCGLIVLTMAELVVSNRTLRH